MLLGVVMLLGLALVVAALAWSRHDCRRIGELTTTVYTPAPSRISRPPGAARDIADRITDVRPRTPRQTADQIARVVLDVETLRRSEGLSAAVLLGVMEVESGFRPTARGRAGEIGLMQVSEVAGANVAPVSLLLVGTNIYCGAKYLMALHGKFVDDGLEARNEFHASLLAYNAGPLAVRTAFAGRNAISLRHYAKVRKAIARWQAAGY
jgi:hypothetical protein